MGSHPPGRGFTRVDKINIQNIVLAASFLAAADGRTVTMGHLIRATQREYQKMGKVSLAGELGGARPGCSKRSEV